MFRDSERPGSMEWYLSDHLGSTSLMIDESGLEIERTDYFPYGQIQSGGTEKYGFTGQENDADTELMYYGARYYSPEYRVFVQPDTLLPDPYNPQALNRYAYALANPMKYTDPRGDYVESAIFWSLSLFQDHFLHKCVNHFYICILHFCDITHGIHKNNIPILLPCLEYVLCYCLPLPVVF
jgi:RHS repeat-associated protein